MLCNRNIGALFLSNLCSPGNTAYVWMQTLLDTAVTVVHFVLLIFSMSIFDLLCYLKGHVTL